MTAEELNVTAAQLAKFTHNPYKHGRADSPTRGAGQTVDAVLPSRGSTPEVLRRHLLGRPGCLAVGYLPR